MKLKTETICIPASMYEVERYVFTKYELTELLIEAFTKGSERAFGNEEANIKDYINNLFKD